MITKFAATAVIVLSMINAWLEVASIERGYEVEEARR